MKSVLKPHFSVNPPEPLPLRIVSQLISLKKRIDDYLDRVAVTSYNHVSNVSVELLNAKIQKFMHITQR